MDKKYITFIFIFAIALVVGTIIDGPKKSVETGFPSVAINEVNSMLPSEPMSSRESLSTGTPTTVPTSEPIDLGNPPELPTAQQPTLSADYLFTDNFDHNFKTDWRAIDGEFMTIDNHFVATSGRPARVVVGSHNWSNYKVDGIFEHLVGWTRGYNNVTFGIRSSENGENGYYLKLGGYKIECITRKYNADSQVLKSIDTYLINNDTYAFSMQALGDRLTFFIDNKEVCTFTDASISSGLFLIEIDPGDSGKYPYIDDIRIREL